MFTEKFTLESKPLLPARSVPPKKFNNVALWTLLCGFVGFFALCSITLMSTKGNASSNPSVVLRATAESDSNSTTAAPDVSIQVDVEQGTLQGKRLKSRAGRDYLAFLGIPYAQPPIGELRFKPPVKAEAWDGIRDATYFRDTCIEKQRIGDKKLAEQADITEGSEDCLYLNVYTPKEPNQLSRRRRRFPVMVYIHGGAGGAFGSGKQYGADYFMDQNVTLITLEYRLGVLGNLNTNTSSASGNQGLKDQVMALQWIQDNISNFGGNRRKVTLFGNSFGGIQVSSHMLSPMSDGLFHRAIAQSGTMLYPGFFSDSPLEDAYALGDILDCPDNSTNEELTQCFMNTTASDLVLSSLKLKNKYNYVFTISTDTASAEGDVFLPLNPLDSLMAGNLKSIPFITGIVDAEGLKDALEVLINPTALDAFNTNWTQSIVPSLYLQYSAEDTETAEEIADEIYDFYFGNETISNRTERNFTNVYTDRLYAHPAATLATFLLDKNNATSATNSRRSFPWTRRQENPQVYFYYFSHEVDQSRADPAQLQFDGGEAYLGECHADELQFFFPFEAFPYIPMDHKFTNFSQMVVRLWATFADTGVPTGADNNATWMALNATNPYQLFELNDEPKMTQILNERIGFWNTFNLTDLYR